MGLEKKMRSGLKDLAVSSGKNFLFDPHCNRKLLRVFKPQKARF